MGLWNGTPILDLDYSEDSRAQVDMNLVVTERVKAGGGPGNCRRGSLRLGRAEGTPGPGDGGNRFPGSSSEDRSGDMRMRLVVATRSQHKMREIREILADVPALEVLDLDEAGVVYSPEEESLEPFDTFEENAASKARYFWEKTGLPTVADDSGLEVDALNGAPGVRTKRFAPGDDLDGEERDLANNAHLLNLLKGKGPNLRGARYVCVAALASGREEVETFRGEAPGIVLENPRGGGGFGYDPIILDEASGKSFAELTAEEKNSRSHRGRAFRALGEMLKER